MVEEGSDTMDVMNTEDILLKLKIPIGNRNEDVLCPLIAEPCIRVCQQNPSNFNVDNVRVGKRLGKHDSITFRGMVLKADSVVGSVKRTRKEKVVVIARGIDTTATGTILTESPEQGALCVLVKVQHS
ncbi:T-complex protein 1 subunit theta [Tanacetum coccineum]